MVVSVDRVAAWQPPAPEADRGHPAAAGTARRIVFLHNPRTGGETFRRILRRQFPASAQLVIQDGHYVRARIADHLPADVGRIALVQGHLPYGAGDVLGPDVVYVTWLRHPVERIASMYRYRCRKARQNGVPPMSLRRFLSSGKIRDVDNGQTRRLAGLDPPFGQCPDDLLDLAKWHLDEGRCVFGITERFDESLILLRRYFGWRNVLYSRENSTAGDASVPLSEADVEAIREYNRLDLELYRYAQARLDETLKRQPVDFALEVRAFKAANRLFGAARWRYKRARRAVRSRLPGVSPAASSRRSGPELGPSALSWRRP